MLILKLFPSPKLLPLSYEILKNSRWGKHLVHEEMWCSFFFPPSLKVLSQSDTSSTSRTRGEGEADSSAPSRPAASSECPPGEVTRAQPQCSASQPWLLRASCELPCFYRSSVFIPRLLQVDFKVKAEVPGERRAYGFLYSKKEVLPVLGAHNDSFTPVHTGINWGTWCSVHCFCTVPGAGYTHV